MNTHQNSININVELIESSETNQIFRNEKELSDKSLKEFAESIKLNGVIQPIVVRPKKDEDGKFVLIAGERRWRGSKIAGLSEIPCTIKNVTSDEAFRLQMIENLQREGVHPLNEAEGFKRMLDNDQTISTKALALMVSKSEGYIVQRLKLIDLIPQAKKDFKCGKMNLGHALMIARRSEEDQKCAIEHLTRQGSYGPIDQLREFIERNIMNDLAQAPFQPHDHTLIPEVGSCLQCPKRTGASKLLFSDIKENDRCMDRGCFLLKCHQHLTNQVKDIIETKPDVRFLCDYASPDERILNLLNEHKLTALKEYTDFNTYGTEGKVKGLWITGNKAGKIQNVYLSQRHTNKDKDGVETPDGLITKIKDRVKRGRELDDEKIYNKILVSLSQHETQKKECKKKMLPDEEAFLWFVILDRANWNLKRDLKTAIGVKKETPEKLYNALRSLTVEKKAFLLRKVMLDQYGGNYPQTDYGFIIKKIARAYGDIDIKTFESEQNDIRLKREERAKERISTIKKSSKTVHVEE